MEKLHYTDLIKAHRYLMNQEGRFRFYQTYMESRTPDVWFRSVQIPLKDALLLFGWVHSWDPNFEGELLIFLQIHKRMFPVIKHMDTATLVTTNLTDKLKTSIGNAFNEFASCCRTSRFESTDASKLLHGMHPDFFVMWDNAIKKGFRSVGVIKASRQQSRDFDGECYAFEFLPEMQRRAFAFLDSYTHDNGGDHLSATRELSRAMDGYSLAKVIDELNYARFTKRISLDDIRQMPL